MSSVILNETQQTDVAASDNVFSGTIPGPYAGRLYPELDLPSRGLTWFLRVLCCIALGASGYLAYASLTHSGIAGCGGGAIFDCDHVTTTKWSKVGGVPVSIPAFALYTVALITLSICHTHMPQRQAETAWTVISLIALSAAMAGVWFICLQVFVIKHLCIYCLVAHSCGLIFAGTVLWKGPVRWQRMLPISTVAAAGIAGLMIMQINAKAPPTFTIVRDEPDPLPPAALASITDMAPTDDAPLDEVPTDGAPFDEAPVDNAPVDGPPVDDAPVDEAPVDAPPFEVDEPPVDAPPVDEAPTDEPPIG